jgi:molybdenum cofactor cytidylyltransferase
MQPMLSAILLAAGQSKRMGKPKQLMPLGKHTLLEQAVDNLLNSSVGETIVVVGHKAEEITEIIAKKPVKIVLNPDYQQGMSTSIIAGLIMVDPRSRAVMLALGDQPLVASRTINQLIEAFKKNKKGIAVPTYQGRRGHPIIFDIKYKSELFKLKGDIGGREIIRDHPDDVLKVAVDSESVVSDIDTQEDYKANLS